MHNGAGGSGMGWMIFFGVLLIAGLVLLAVVLVRLLSGGLRQDGSTSRGVATAAPEAGFESARRILAERYARGEIDTQEYQTRLRTLEGS